MHTPQSIKVMSDIPPPPSCHCMLLRRAARTVTTVYDAGLATVGLTATQYAQLRAIQRLEAPSITQLARLMGLDRTTMGRNLSALISAGLVRHDDIARDARERRIALTAAGRRALRRAEPMWQASQQRLAAQLGPERMDLLRGLLAEIEAAVP